MRWMNNIFEVINDAKSIAIAGHIRPDGDCLGSVTGLASYIKDNYPDKNVEIFLENVPERFADLAMVDKIVTDYPRRDPFDVFISLDCADMSRFEQAKEYFENATLTVNIDHHISNNSYAKVNHVLADSSSTAEVLFNLMDEDKISYETARSLYTGIIHDTGVFKHSSTSPATMNVAGKLMAKGLNVSSIIDDSFYRKTYTQNQILGRCLLESMLVLDGKVVVSALSRKMMAFYGATSEDLDGIIDQLRVTKGVEVAILIHETGEQIYKVSMRSNGKINVNTICSYFGGGGHVRASGCMMSGSLHDVINNLTEHIEKQIKEIGGETCITE